ncbi:MerR family DNA-binding transcriptional regulator [Sphingomonas koreensis]|nr:MerR family DNA-binding transcriptional regulator [Sphingomonas koreensis]TPG42760.1 MerR family DNA-binding transcriptional regulator [Sphingomonas koreensis]
MQIVSAHAAIEPHPDREHYSISDLSAEFDVTARALRFYEDEGLIAPERRGTQRIYSHRDRARLAWILRGKRVGFSLAEIREMIDLYDIGDGRRVQRDVTLARCRERVATLDAQKRDIDASIDELNDFIALLEAGRAELHKD